MDRNPEPATPGPDELAAMELFHQLLALSPAGHETALRLTVRLGNGRYVGDALLSEKDVAALNDTLVSLNAFRADLEDETAPNEGEAPAPGPVTVPLIEDVPELTADEAAEFHAGIQGFFDQDGDR